MLDDIDKVPQKRSKGALPDALQDEVVNQPTNKRQKLIHEADELDHFKENEDAEMIDENSLDVKD